MTSSTPPMDADGRRCTNLSAFIAPVVAVETIGDPPPDDGPGDPIPGDIGYPGAMDAQTHDQIKTLLIQMRRYFIHHNCMVGECVAWQALKTRFGVGQRDADDEAWMAAHTQRPFALYPRAD